jgi:flagellar motor protein MotB
MKVFPVIGTTALFLIFAATVPTFAQEEHQEAKPEKQEQAKPAKQEEQAKPAKQEEQAKAKPEKQEQAKPAKQEQQAKPAKQEEQAKAKPEKQQQQNAQVKQEGGNRNAGQQHAQRTPAEEQKQRSMPTLRLSARGEGRIPDDRFRSNFGEQHTFVINAPVMVGGYSRFQEGGFWFGFVNPWPVGWYYTDDVYVDYIDGGYFLFNPYYPGVRVSLCVVI